MFGLGLTEWIVILLVIMLVFGATRLPALGKGMGEAMRNFRDAFKGGSDEPTSKPPAERPDKRKDA